MAGVPRALCDLGHSVFLHQGGGGRAFAAAHCVGSHHARLHWCCCPSPGATGALRNLGKHLGWLVLFASIELVGPFYLIALGEQAISSSLAGILLSAVPLTVLLIAPLMGVKEHISARRLVGLAVGLIGVVALLGIDSLHSTHEWLGAGLHSAVDARLCVRSAHHPTASGRRAAAGRGRGEHGSGVARAADSRASHGCRACCRPISALTLGRRARASSARRSGWCCSCT